MAKEIMTISVPPAVKEGMVMAAAERARSVSGLCSEILIMWLRAKYPGAPRPTPPAPRPGWNE